MRDSKGTALPPVNTHAVLGVIEQMEDDAQPILFTELCHKPNRTELVVIEEVRFIETTAPAGCKGEGGIVYLTLRTVQ